MTRTGLILALFAVTAAASIVHYLLVALVERLRGRLAIGAFVLFLALYAGVVILRPASWVLSDLCLLLAAAGFAVVFGPGLASVPGIISFSIAASLADILSFTLGPTRLIIHAVQQTGSASLLNYLALTVPLAGRAIPVVGVGDFLIMGTYFFTLRRLAIAPWICFLIPTVGLLVALAVGLLVGGVYAIPFMAATVVGYLLLVRRKA